MTTEAPTIIRTDVFTTGLDRTVRTTYDDGVVLRTIWHRASLSSPWVQVAP